MFRVLETIRMLSEYSKIVNQVKQPIQDCKGPKPTKRNKSLCGVLPIGLMSERDNPHDDLFLFVGFRSLSIFYTANAILSMPFHLVYNLRIF